MTANTLTNILDGAINARAHLFDARHESAFRLFNGFAEGCPALVVDLYAATLVLCNYADPPEQGAPLVEAAQEWLLSRLAWVRAAIVKTRNRAEAEERQGRLVYGISADRRIREHGVWYAIDITMN